MTTTIDRKTATEAAEAIRIQDAGKQYENGTLALSNIHLSVHEGEFVSLVGPSGCGKSTLLRIMAGLDQATSGKVQIQSEQASFVFQEANLMPWRTVVANVALPLEISGVSAAERKQRALAALEKVGLTAHADSYPRQLSGGMKMRVSIARALVSEPKLLFMDEPFGALDEMTRHRLHEELLNIWMNSNLTIVFVTHSVFEAVYLSGRVVAMEAHPGTIKQIIPIEESYPRTNAFMTSPQFGEKVREITNTLT
ncbi:ABC transporter ATP-binding protein [Paenibacillus glycanilyticus]|uniref:Nitrate/sulfonate/bicarbonate ABC transporter ATP-binding protein n=1 Tax=Paenibacillus glycanilyticus TaxID=126569 RepID=A0ABQ6G9M6_9BACL|nr:ABC transporter ATP-binding protein [Paenibacillus glycanilyticus]GLX67200.1 nitrate/sulfonate/bicarbonate ABC transporter ATP-binding protein [Paenibacillus glycanilyticus]